MFSESCPVWVDILAFFFNRRRGAEPPAEPPYWFSVLKKSVKIQIKIKKSNWKKFDCYLFL
jgi:hypothetical protein